MSMRMQFKDTVLSLAEHDPRIVLVFGDISVFLFREFWTLYPDRFFNAGICENTLVSVSGGLSAQGYHPFVHTITPFLTDRSFEQIKLDLCYNEFGANIVSCGASFDYAWDGATHHSYTDLAQLRRLPGMEVLQPGSKKEFDLLMRSQYNNGKPTYYRISHDEHGESFTPVFGKGIIVRENTDAKVTVMTAGPILGNVIKACSDLPVNIVYFHTIKPMDEELVHRFRNTHILVVHDAFGLLEAIADIPDLKLKYHGLPDKFNCYYGTLDDIRGDLNLDPRGIRQAVLARLQDAVATPQ
jgi:transketolase